MSWPRAVLGLACAALPAVARAQDQEAVSCTGNVALIDLGRGTYQGFEGGLYPGGSNVPPAQHLQHALEAARAIQPLDAQGAPDPENGLIAFLSIGLSNAAHEFAEFERQQDLNGGRNPRLVLVNGGQAGQSSDAIDDPAAWYWELVVRRLEALELSPAQVQIAWVRQSRAPAFQAAIARRRGEPPPEVERSSRTFPAPAQRLCDELEQIALILRQFFPNLRLCYVSDRTFHGYKEGFEPNAYEAGFAVKWLIEAQIGGKAELAFGAEGACAPLLLWGPYLWADGELQNGQGTCWLREDFEVERPDHPSRLGELKVAGLLGDFFARDPSAAPWFARAGGAGGAELVLREAVADAHVERGQPAANFGSAPALLSSDAEEARSVAYLRFDLSGVRRPVLHAKLSLRNVEGDDSGDPRAVRLVADDGWDEALLCSENAPELGPALGTIPRASRDSTRSLAVTAAVNQEPDDFLSLAVTAKPDGLLTAFLSRESGDAPRLVIIERREP